MRKYWIAAALIGLTATYFGTANAEDAATPAASPTQAAEPAATPAPAQPAAAATPADPAAAATPAQPAAAPSPAAAQSDMVGQMVYSSKGTKIGSISSVSTDAQGQQQAVVGVERYLGLGGKNVLFPISSLKTRSKGGLTTTLTSSEIKQLPEATSETH